MLLSLTLSLSLLSLLIGSVLGNLHASCTCHNGDSYNWRITINACTVYNNASYQWGGTQYDTPSGRCDATKGGSIAGDQWYDTCKQVAKSGFRCASGVGTCYANENDVEGWC